MACKRVTHGGIESTIKSEISARAVAKKRGSSATEFAIHSVAERTSGCIAALFCCADMGAGGVIVADPVAMVKTSVITASGAGIIEVTFKFRQFAFECTHIVPLIVQLACQIGHNKPLECGGRGHSTSSFA
jgi:hypothetical protein